MLRDNKISYLKHIVSRPIDDMITQDSLFSHAKRFDFELGYLEIVSIDYRGDNGVVEGKWAVINKGSCWNKSSHKFVYEPSPSNRTDRFFKNTRFTFEEALKIVKLIRRRVIRETADAGAELVALEKEGLE